MSGENWTESSTLEPPYSDVEPWLRGLHSCVAISLMVVSILGNTLVLWMVVRNKELQYRSMLAGMGAVTVNLLFSVFTNPQVLTGSITGEWPLTQNGCVALGFISTSIFYVRWMNALLIAIDRLLYIITPFFYQRNTKRILVALTVVVWTLPFLSNAPSAIRRTYSYRSTLTFCAIECSEDDICVLSYIVIFTGYLIVGMLCPTAIYIFLYCFGKKKRRDMHRELGTHAHSEPPCPSNGHCGLQLTATRPGELAGISEEEGEVEMMEDLPRTDNPFSTQEELTLTQESEMHTHKVPATNCSHNGGTHLSPPLPLPLGCELRSKDTLTPLSPTTSHQDTNNEGPDTSPLPPHTKRRVSIDTCSSPSHRRPSLLLLSRATLTAILPGKQQMAIKLRERQAMITFAIIFTNLVITQIPLFILSTTRRQSFFPSIPIWVHLITVNLYFLAPALEPIIIMRNTDFKTVLSRMLRRRHSYSLSNSGMR